MAVNDIIEVVKDRFNDFGLYVCQSCNVYTKTLSSHTRCGVIYFYDDFVCYNCNYGDKDRLIYYNDLDVDVLVGLFLCEVYYNGR